ncbi:hypothetical protein PMPD1_0047 [Paramixta manurensis]|uniref:Uncharacterized protein n=1 Tax=Paramixta manurensis TaxID=2740817 RepID=A0A6M8U3B7_9GAMM|nr:hypothetical protein PMPD1_0047 [Erwiniaceae bacterium PD-1]
MGDDLHIIAVKLVGFIGCALFLVLMMGLVYIDVNWMNNAVHELSFTEIIQETILGCIALLFFASASRRGALKYSLVLVGGFFTCMLIRELDFLFDTIHHGAWVWFALAVAVICLLFAARSPAKTLAGLATLMRHPGWNMMVAGLLTILVYSRLFGMHQLWQQLMLEGYNRTVKNMAEEGTELLGYSLCLFATLRYLWDLRHLKSEPKTIAWQSH